MHITPIRQDKRFMFAVGTVAAVLAMDALHRGPSEHVLTFVEVVLLAFMGQSQFGQSYRAAKAPPAEPKQ
jgi:hypothetical protein